ncbi:MAG TPA: DJ-1/PfpI family protein, partial [Candidatus Blautia avistercoris]|nr:DJ-1/PfpI family protein [Candidatus Blautia avistercoris]
MKKVSVFLADGFEDVEGLAVIDILRRAGVSVTTVSIKEEKEIVSSHGIPMKTDTLYKDMDFSQMDMLVLPGGGKGTEN